MVYCEMNTLHSVSPTLLLNILFVVHLNTLSVAQTTQHQNGWMSNERLILKGRGRKRSWPILKYYICTGLDGSREAKNNQGPLKHTFVFFRRTSFKCY
jgi:hypothetical protein